MLSNERLFYNKYKYRIRFILRRGLGLLRSSYLYDDNDHLLETLEDRRRFFIDKRKGNHNFSWIWNDIWDLDAREVDMLLNLFQYRENFDPLGSYRVETPVIDFYTSNIDYVKLAEDTGLEPELCSSATDEPNTIVVKKLPYETFQLKCLTRYEILSREVADALLDYEHTGEIKFPWTWETRRMMLRFNHVPVPDYIYAQNEDSLCFVSLIAGDVISTVYSYKLDK